MQVKISSLLIFLGLILATIPVHGQDEKGLMSNLKDQPATTSDTTGNYITVKHAIEQSIGWAIEKDFDAMYRLWAEDMFHFWLFSDSKVIGLENFKKYSEFWKDPGFRGTRFEFRDLRIVFSRSGDVAWYSCYLDDCSSYKRKETCLKNVFQTGVLERRDGRWVHVMMHGAYPIDKIPENYVRRYYTDLFESKKEK